MYIFSCYCILLRLFNHCTISLHYNLLTHLILCDISHVVFTNIVSFATTAAHPRLGFVVDAESARRGGSANTEAQRKARSAHMKDLNDGGAEHLCIRKRSLYANCKDSESYTHPFSHTSLPSTIANLHNVPSSRISSNPTKVSLLNPLSITLCIFVTLLVLSLWR